ncbi:MAG: hypothetical protein ISS27_00495 [Candidatus Omnitrophica bacterium]|nr:hypothetical protein [Candidatus Omnitrophota bacterium]
MPEADNTKKSMINRNFLIILVLVFLIWIIPAGNSLAQEPKAEFAFFYASGCGDCLKVKEEVLPILEKEFAGTLRIDYRDIADVENFKYMLALAKKYDRPEGTLVPMVYSDGIFLYGVDEIERNLGSLILGSRKGQVDTELLPQVDLHQYFDSFSPLLIASAGLIDGINPCAFTVIVFFMSFLALQGYRKREMVVIGCSFILAVMASYILIGLGIFGFLYQIRRFFLVIKVFNLAVGSFSILFGGLAIYDALKFKRTGGTDGQILQLPTSIKNRIHKVIGEHYRKGNKGGGGSGGKVLLLAVSALVTGFLVSLLEAVCTGQTYLPTIAFILKSGAMQMEAVGYLLLYNFMFIAPLVIIFLCALFGATSGEFSSFLKKHFLLVKLLMAALFFCLGVLIIWRA